MIFASDNWAGAHPDVMAGLARHAAGFSRAYGAGDLDRAVTDRFSVLFEREVAVFFVATGTAANSLALASAAKPGGVAFVHRDAHVATNEAGAAEFLGGGGRLCLVDGPLGRMEPERLEAAIGRYPAEFLHYGRPTAISITQTTEVGTVHTLDQIDAIAAVARRHALPVHMDGARFANALVALETTPADMTWRRGVDMLSFGGTKNGCWCAEALVLFDPKQADEFRFMHKRSAQLFSKARFVSAQFEAYFSDDLWLKTARHANRMADRLVEHIRESRKIRLAWDAEANMVFALMAKDVAEDLKTAGVAFYVEPLPEGFDGAVADGEVMGRFVTSFASTEEEVDRFGALIAG
ncbi:MAG: low specificity L-threonine aldolase [Rhizobiaceae bacterium]|nr:low specificity L-threonine aldolase [Rhizobiaceae bacterium]